MLMLNNLYSLRHFTLGAGDYSQLGEILEWGGKNRTHYPDTCGQIKGK